MRLGRGGRLAAAALVASGWASGGCAGVHASMAACVPGDPPRGGRVFSGVRASLTSCRAILQNPAPLAVAGILVFGVPDVAMGAAFDVALLPLHLCCLLVERLEQGDRVLVCPCTRARRPVRRPRVVWLAAGPLALACPWGGACRYRGWLREGGSAAVRTLVAMLGDPDPEARLAAARAALLSLEGADDEWRADLTAAAPALLARRADPDPRVRAVAVAGLLVLGGGREAILGARPQDALALLPEAWREPTLRLARREDPLAWRRVLEETRAPRRVPPRSPR